MKREKAEMLTAKKFAQRAGITYPTMMAWLKKGLVPGAVLKEDSNFGKYWEIPATSLDEVQKQKTGPKPAIGTVEANPAKKRAAKKGN
jgi:hypothetical protein